MNFLSFCVFYAFFNNVSERCIHTSVSLFFVSFGRWKYYLLNLYIIMCKQEKKSLARNVSLARLFYVEMYC